MIVSGIFIMGMLVNSLFLERFYIYEQKKMLDAAAKEIPSMKWEDIETRFEVVIISTQVNGKLETINDDLMWKFEQKKIKLNKFWITQDTLDTLKYKSVYRVYDQGYSQFKVLTKFLRYNDDVFAVALPMPAMVQTINIVNKFNVILMGISVLLIAGLLWLLTRKIITAPLEALRDLSEDISNLKFRQTVIHTNDEMGQLSASINKMSRDIERAYGDSNEKNIKLKELLSNVSHELKTPLSLIKAYEQGKADGLDDGTYDNIIGEQLDKMEALIERLLFWVKIEGSPLSVTEFDLREKIKECLKKYQLIFQENHIQAAFTARDDSWYVSADEQAMEIVLDNLITNAIKYASDKKLDIQLCRKASNVELTIANGVSGLTDSKLEQLWRPFFVLEKSRSKELSGTGLGLPIVKSILEAHHFDFGFSLEDGQLIFHVTLL